MSTMNPLTNPLLFHPPPPPSFDPSSLPLQTHFPHLIRTIGNESYQTNTCNSNINNNHTTLQDLTLKTEQQQYQDFSSRRDIPSWLSTTTTSSFYSPVLENNHFIHESHQPLPPPLLPQSHISATALLQKAAQMGSTMSRSSPIHSQMAGHSNGAGLGLPSSPSAKGFANVSTASNHFLQMMNSLTQGPGFRENDGRLEEGGSGGVGGGRKLHEFFIM